MYLPNPSIPGRMWHKVNFFKQSILYGVMVIKLDLQIIVNGFGSH